MKKLATNLMVLFLGTIVLFQMETHAQGVYRIKNYDSIGGEESTDNLTKYDKIYKLFEESDNILSQNYAGAYVDDQGQLNILIVDELNEVINYLESFFSLDGVVFLEGKYRYKDLLATQHVIDDYIIEQMDKKDFDSGIELPELMDYYPSTWIDEINNQLVVRFYMSDDLTLVDQAIDLFEKEFGKLEYIEYQTRSELSSSACATVSPGMSLDTQSFISNTTCSVGYRAIRNGSEYGFVTCGHGLSVEGDILVGSNHIGDVTSVMYGNGLPGDASFVKLKANNTCDNAVMYTSPNLYLFGSLGNYAVGNILYKSGGTTHISSGTIQSIHFSDYITFNNTTYYFIELISASGSFVSPGDSGGVAYVKHTSTTGYVIGITTAKAPTYSLFSKASYINATLSLSSY